MQSGTAQQKGKAYDGTASYQKIPFITVLVKAIHCSRDRGKMAKRSLQTITDLIIVYDEYVVEIKRRGNLAGCVAKEQKEKEEIQG